MHSQDTRLEFEGLLTPYMDGLFGYAIGLTRDRSEAEDVLQESIYRALRGFHGFDPGSNFKAWMFRIVTNTFISSRRRESSRPRLVDAEAVSQLAVEASDELPFESSKPTLAYEDVVEDEVKQALDNLPEEFRVPLLLSALQGLSYKEISRELAVPIGTVMSRLHRARQRLRTLLSGYAGNRVLTPTFGATALSA